MTPNEKWDQHIHITNQKRDEQNLTTNQHETGGNATQDYQYLRQNLKPKSSNYYTTVSAKVSK
jgi:hypothetical protein